MNMHINVNLNVDTSRGRYTISTDPQQLDLVAIHAFLSQSYWSPGIPLKTVERAITNSLCFGIFHETDQIGFARVITDKATFAYLADVYLLEAHRGQGLAKWLMEVITAHEALQNLRRFMLVTRDGHGLYKKFGFAEQANPSRTMEIVNPDVYKPR
jgi:GNAT superfamily N-acetyltransferase